MKILIILTGGTIGCTTKNGITAPDSCAVAALLDRCLPPQTDASASAKTKPAAEAPAYDIISPYYILSEELTAIHLNRLSEAVSENLRKGYDGILITHGSDTLPYTAAALDLMFADSSVPIALVCGNYPLSDSRSNGFTNFETALAFLRQMPGCSGAYVCYRNEETNADSCGKTAIHKGLFLLRQPEASGDLRSRYGRPFAWYDGQNVLVNDAAFASASAPLSVRPGRTVLSEASDILPVSCAPGAVYPCPPDDVRAVLLSPYHSGTLPVKDPAFAKFCAQCMERNLPVYIPTGGCETFYASSEAFSPLGVIPVDCGYAALYMALWILHSSD